jgi:hypothetical protein
MEEYVKDIPTGLILRIDEVGSSEWTNCKKRDVIIPAQARDQTIEWRRPGKAHWLYYNIFNGGTCADTTVGSPPKDGRRRYLGMQSAG